MSIYALPSPGLVVAGRYRIEETLAGEGTSAVLRATDTRAERAVALRMLPLAPGGDDGDRCTRQGKLAARLSHPNLARVLDFGTDDAAGVQYVAAELGTGGTLAALLSQRGAPPLALGLRMLQEAAAGLAAAHAAGAVHGDLHPGMLWLSRGGGKLRVEVLGLGMDPAGAPPARATARYASPERLRRMRDLAPAADVFSLGVIAYEVLAGLPADWNTLLIAMARGQAVGIPSPLGARPELPPELADAVLRAISPAPADRWPDAGEFAAALAVLLPAEPAPARAAIPLAIPVVRAPEPDPEPRVEAVEAPKTIAFPVPIVAAPVDEAAAPEVVVVAESEPVEAAVDEVPAIPTRSHAVTLSAADLADSLYIPPQLMATRPEPKPAPATPAAPVDAPVVHSPDLPRPIAAPPVVHEEPPVAIEPPARTIAAPVETVAAADVIPIDRRAMRMGAQPGRGRGGLIAAGVALAILLGGGALAARTVIGRPGAGVANARLAAKTLTSESPTVAGAAQAAPATERAPVQADVPAATPATAEEERRIEAERLKQEQLRRDQQRRTDSLRAAQLATARPTAAPVQAAPVQAPGVAEPRPAAPAAMAPPPAAVAQAPAEPARSRVDLSRVYGSGEVDQPPALTNRSELAGAILRNYPSALAGTGTPGGAVVQFVVTPDGRVDRSSIRVIEVSHPAFRRSAAAAVAGARFTPARLDGQAVRAEVSIPLTWNP